ncbi:C2H2-type domain-containing protein [Purpureocillium lavendulum]|uniref:C2H2-type domain-containing protein n=1 Tax=Purpureocillium lavendulum TaxID=1247861 RepID=A0AB34FD61_9HYPO|nr:C2H2-type domain-containing protein [Purpureocillium lavendulum]
MTYRSAYLAKYRGSASQRAHFAIFFPNAADDGKDLSREFRSSSCKGTIIHVVGEPVMNGYTLEFKRNYECSTSRDLQEMVPLGYVDPALLYTPPNTKFVKENTARAGLEREAAMVPPPRGGQNIRAPIDGVNSKRCQEWTMEYLHRLAEQGFISTEAVDIAQSQRDPPDHGIFGRRGADRRREQSGQQVAGRAPASQNEASNIEWVWDEDYQRYRYWDVAKGKKPGRGVALSADIGSAGRASTAETAKRQQENGNEMMRPLQHLRNVGSLVESPPHRSQGHHNCNFHSAAVSIAAGHDAQSMIETCGDRGQKSTDRTSAIRNEDVVIEGVRSNSPAFPYPKRKRKFLHANLNEYGIESSQTAHTAEALPPPVRNTKRRKVHWGSPVKAVLGYWRDSPVPEPDRRHAVIGFIDVLDRLRTRIQPRTTAGEPIKTYPLPPEPSANWVKFEGIVFADHLVGLDSFQIKEYVRIATQESMANEMSDEDLVRVAMARAKENHAYDNPAKAPSIACGLELPGRRDSRAEPKRRTTSNGFATINTNLAELPNGRNLCHCLTEKCRHSIRRAAQAHSNIPAIQLIEAKANDELTKAEAAQTRAEKYANRREQLAEGAAATTAGAVPSTSRPVALFYEPDDLQRMGDRQTCQQTLPTKPGARDAKFYDGVKYERKSTGPFIGKLVSRGAIIEIDGEDYVEYRVLTKPSLF